ncbi:MAG: TetR/AcrR family transcriptional regulator [Sulfurimonas sp.]|jgi:TetR/AcrR family acrAB operon transcriptional repressor|nr:TetR/AcrR family transcriptional regulator [Sulfurimonas sp.]MBU3938465.1 TetR/AcrR family transcriptional regulator [bacterium]MBU4025454.1 TetR/AcrR family transcriptional regulator [bacterium]MBU4059210.1 TetR/AcrR family transcriptional regulator [bacterium]MBU4111407.1 TetR/AcrR family transcriptional regulator [bacterium]
MAIIVDKIQKKKDIALSCKSLVVQEGISTLTISRLAKEAKIGKGTVYEYFKNKEEIVFEIANIMMQEHSQKLHEQLLELGSTKEKVKKFSEFFYSEEEKELREIYKEFVSLSLMKPNAEMVAFQTECFNNYYNWFGEILQAGVQSGELRAESLALARGLFVVGEGMFIAKNATNAIEDLKQELDTFIDTLFTLLEVQK